MTANVIHQARSGPRPLALFVRVGRNDHREMDVGVKARRKGSKG
jgi:hypothetical protein